MQRLKMAAGMLVGAVVLQVGFMACSAVNTTGMLPDFLDAGKVADTGVLGGHDAVAQTMPCTQWEIKIVRAPATLDMAAPVDPGWEPVGAYVSNVLLRRCTAP